MYTIADAWGWTWEKDLKNKAPQRWSQEWEVKLAVKLMTKVNHVLFAVSPLILIWFLNFIQGILLNNCHCFSSSHLDHCFLSQ